MKAGEVRGNTLTVTAGGDTITLECSGRVASGNAPYNLYVLYNAAWRPAGEGNRNSFLMGTAESAE